MEIIKSRIDPDANAQQVELLAVVADEARKHKLDVMVHAVSPKAMLAAVKAGATKLVHTPHNGWLTEAEARVVRDAGIETLSTIGFGVPVFGVFNNNNVPTFRDGNPWPSGILDGQGKSLPLSAFVGSDFDIRQRQPMLLKHHGLCERQRIRHRHLVIQPASVSSRREPLDDSGAITEWNPCGIEVGPTDSARHDNERGAFPFPHRITQWAARPLLGAGLGLHVNRAHRVVFLHAQDNVVTLL